MNSSKEYERLSIIRLHLIPEIGPRRFSNILERFGTAAAAVTADAGELASVEDISQQLAKKIFCSRTLDDAEKELERADKSGASVITCADDAYPRALKEIQGCPPVIYVKGELTAEDEFSVAVVGTRHPTSYGASAAASMARELAGLGLSVVSGLARGIDTEAHTAALAAKGRTIAVLGNGLNRHYPPENRKLEEKIAASGALVSEFRMDQDPDKGNFPRRNRLISGLSLATLVVEAGEKSGALITAKYALEQGKDVFAVPGPVFSKYSKGPHLLIKQGAKLTESAGDIVEELAPLLRKLRSASPKPPAADESPAVLEGAEKNILELVEAEYNGVSADRISSMLKAEPAEVFSGLTTLEIKGLIRCLPGKVYIRNR